MGNIVIPGLSDSSKVPQYSGLVQFGASQVRFGSLPVKCLCVGLKTSGGSLGLDGPIARIMSKEDADTYTGAGSELDRMLCAAIEETLGMEGFELYAATPTGFGGAAATLTITVTGSLTAATGTIYCWVGGDLVEVSVTNGQSVTQVAAAIATAFGTKARIAVTAGAVVGVVTLTDKTAGIRGNQKICYVDFSLAAGLTLALGGAGAATTSATPILGRFFGGGTGTEVLTTLLSSLYPTFHKFIAWAQNDATSLAEIELHIDAKAGPTEGHKQHSVVSNNGNFAAATSIASSTLNNARFHLPWLEISEVVPSEISAAIACLRAASEQSGTVNKAYDNYPYRVLKPQRFPSDWVTSFAEKQAALDVGVSPLETRADGKVYMVRSITTRCLDGATPTYTCLDTSESYVPDYVNERLELVWTTEYKVANPYVSADPGANEPEKPAGVGTPKSWSARVNAELYLMERELILDQVSTHLAESDFNYTAKRIMTVNPVVPLSHMHSIGVITKGMSPSTP